MCYVCSKELSQEWGVLQKWGKAWDMGFNPSKCQVLHISRSHGPIKHSFTMHRQVLDSIDHARYLGVEISSDLNFNHHINHVTVNASKSLGFLKRNIKTKHPGIHEAAYKTTVRTQVEYASSVWSPYTKKDIQKVEMDSDGSEKGYLLDSQLLLSLPKCYGTPTTTKSEKARKKKFMLK